MQFAIERILDEKIAAREKEERIRQLNSDCFLRKKVV
jgi:hypothetical protein